MPFLVRQTLPISMVWFDFILFQLKLFFRQPKITEVCPRSISIFEVYMFAWQPNNSYWSSQFGTNHSINHEKYIFCHVILRTYQNEWNILQCPNNYDWKSFEKWIEVRKCYCTIRLDNNLHIYPNMKCKQF